MDENKIEHADGAPPPAGRPQRGRVVDLLRRREELRGIYPAADLVAENVGWVV